VDTAFYSAMGMQQFVSSGSHPRELAEQLLQQMASFTQDIAMVSVTQVQGTLFQMISYQGVGQGPLCSLVLPGP